MIVSVCCYCHGLHVSAILISILIDTRITKRFRDGMTYSSACILQINIGQRRVIAVVSEREILLLVYSYMYFGSFWKIVCSQQILFMLYNENKEHTMQCFLIMQIY
jgi:glucan phosphoethanolaminetransferase (alkaline phosphatase superfamily)